MSTVMMVQVLPPSVLLARNTSVLVAAAVPWLSAKAMYTVFPVGSLGSTAVLALTLYRNWQPVRVARPSTLLG